MIKRDIAKYIKYISNKYPVTTITGPRQSGKTTLAKYLFQDLPYVNLEHIEERDFAEADPIAFLDNFPNGALIDEIQRVPKLLSYIQVIVDKKNKNRMFILTGSQQFNLLDSINQSLAGRTALVKLLPLSISELKNHDFNNKEINKNILDTNNLIYRGFYPRIYSQNISPKHAYADYYETYVERDVRQISKIHDLSLFNKFIKLCAGRIGQILNLTNLGNDLGINSTTIKEWLSILQASYIIFLLEPYYKNMTKRLVKSPKLYFYDVGLASYLLGLEQQSYIKTHPLRGNLFENLVVLEILKYRFNKGLTDNLNFFRDSKGNEVDIVYNISNQSIPIEIKSAKTISQDFYKGLNYFSKIIKDTTGIVNQQNILVYDGEQNRKSELTITLNYQNLIDFFIKQSL